MLFYIFIKLEIWLQDNTNLRAFKYIRVAKKLAIFVKTVWRNIINRVILKRFLNLSNLVRQCFYQILDALIEIYLHYIKLPNKNFETNAQIKNNSHYASYYQDCLSALDKKDIDVYKAD